MELNLELNAFTENIFPEVLKYAIRALDHEKRQILISVLARTMIPLRFKDFKELIRIRDNDLAYHLKELEKGNIIMKEAEDNEVYYKLSKFGETLLINLLRTVIYNRPKRRGTLSPRSEEIPPLPYDMGYRNDYIVRYEIEKVQEIERFQKLSYPKRTVFGTV